MLDTNMEIMNQDIACLVSEAGPIFYVFKIVMNKLPVVSHILESFGCFTFIHLADILSK